MSDSRLPSLVWKTKIEFLVASGNVIIVPENKDFLYVFLLFSLDLLDSIFLYYPFVLTKRSKLDNNNFFFYNLIVGKMAIWKLDVPLKIPKYTI